MFASELGIEKTSGSLMELEAETGSND